jgi:hypothetical protein
MLAENIQFIWSYIASMSQNNDDLVGEIGLDNMVTGASVITNNMSPQQRNDDYFFNNESVLVSSEANSPVRPRYIPMDSTLTSMETMDEDSVELEQTKMIENLMNIVEFILK